MVLAGCAGVEKDTKDADSILTDPFTPGCMDV
jgi:catalase (peroxidase I)